MSAHHGNGTSTVTGRRPDLVATVDELRASLTQARRDGATIGFVPTMGYLHDGHASLMRRAVADCDLSVASIFVNPLQFAPTEDLDTYPRDLDHDVAVAASCGIDLLFVPEVAEMYPGGGILTSVSVAELSAPLEGASRPTHFAGVATVVTKLLNIVGPCRAYFGEKDFQQLTIIRRLVADLAIPAEIIGCPIIREPDGLAMSSRNVKLDDDERQAATVLSRALRIASAAIQAGERDPLLVEELMTAEVAAEALAELDYSAAVDPATLSRPERLGPDIRLLVAARIGATRLIDNCGVTVDPAQPMESS